MQACSLRLCTWGRGLAALGPGSLGLQPLHLLLVLLDGVLDPGIHHGLGEDPVLRGVRHGLAGRASTEAGQGPELPARAKVSPPQAPGPPGTSPRTREAGQPTLHAVSPTRSRFLGAVLLQGGVGVTLGQVGAEFAREWLAHTLPGQNTHSSRLRAHALLQYTRVPTHACSQVTCRPDLVPSLHHPPGSWPGLAPCVSQRLSKIRKPRGAWEATRPPCGAQSLALTAELPSARHRPQGTPGCRGATALTTEGGRSHSNSEGASGPPGPMPDTEQPGPRGLPLTGPTPSTKVPPETWTIETRPLPRSSAPSAQGSQPQTGAGTWVSHQSFGNRAQGGPLFLPSRSPLGDHGPPPFLLRH